LIKVNKRIGVGDEVGISYDAGGRQVVLRMTKKSRTRVFKIGTIADAEGQSMSVDDIKIDPAAVINVDPSFVDEALKDCEIYGDDVTISVAPPNELRFSASGTIGEMEYSLVGAAEFDESVEVKKARAKFGITQMKNVFKILSVASSARVAVGGDAPIHFSFPITAQAVNGSRISFGTVDYMVAPKIQEEDDIDEINDVDIPVDDEEFDFDDAFDDIDDGAV